MATNATSTIKVDGTSYEIVPSQVYPAVAASSTPYYLLGVPTKSSQSDQAVYETGISSTEPIANMLHLGAYDSYTYNDSTEIYTVTRQTGYYTITGDESWVYVAGSTWFYCQLFVNYTKATSATQTPILKSNMLVRSYTALNGTGVTGLSIDFSSSYYNTLVSVSGISTLSGFISYVKQNPIFIQYQLLSSYTETYDARHFAATGRPYIEAWKCSEANRSANLLNSFDRTNISASSSLNTATLNSDGTYTSTATSDPRGWGYANSDFKFLLLPGTYTFSATKTSTDESSRVGVYSEEGTVITGQTVVSATQTSGSVTITISSITNVGLMCKVYTGNSSFWINRGSVALSYQPYEGQVVHETGIVDRATNDSAGNQISTYYLPLQGGTMTGNITFASIGDTASSSGLVWNGSTDGARIYYNTTASDQGNLVLQMVDDANTDILMNWNSSTIYSFGNTSASFNVSSLQVTGGLASKLVFGDTATGYYNGAGTTDVTLPLQAEATATGSYTVADSIPDDAGTSESTELTTVNAVRAFAGSAKTMTIGSDTSGTQYLTSVFDSGTNKAVNKTSISLTNSNGQAMFQNQAGIWFGAGNEFAFGSSSSDIYINYDNRTGSAGVINTYLFGTSNGSAGRMSGTIKCGNVYVNNGGNPVAYVDTSATSGTTLALKSS